MRQPSSSQDIYQRASFALAAMPKSTGPVACAGRTDFDRLTETSKVPRSVLNELSKICAPCAAVGCQWRQVYQRERNPRKSRAKQ